MTYTDIAKGIKDITKRIIAEDLAAKLDSLNKAMQGAAVQGELIHFNEVDKDYQANLRLYLLAQKQFFALLPNEINTEEKDELTAFNSG